MINEILKELKQPDFLCYFSAPDCSKGIPKNHRYVCKPETGEVFKQSDGKKKFPTSIRLNCNDQYAKSVTPTGLKYHYGVKRERSYIYPSYTEFQYVEKYDKLVLCTWVCHTQDLINLSITNGEPNFPIDKSYDGDALFRLDRVDLNKEGENTVTNLVTLEMARIFNKDKTFEDYDTKTYRILGFSNGYDEIIHNATNIKYVISSLDVCGSFFGNSFIGANSYAVPNDPDNISAFFRAKAPKVSKTSKKQLVIDELCKKTNPIPMLNKGLVCYIDKLDDEWAVIRWISNDEKFEYFRMYVSKKEHLYCRNDGNDRFIYFGRRMSIRTFQADNTIVLNENAFEGTKLEYFKNIYNEVDNKDRSGIIYMLLCYPEFEKLYKAGFKTLCLNHVTRHYGYAWPNYLDEAVMPLDTKASSVYQILGINKYQFDKLKDTRVDVVKSVKKCFNNKDIRDIDNVSFDAVFDVVSKSNNCYYGPAMVLSNISSTYSVQTMVNMAPLVDKINGQRVSTKSRYSYYGSYPLHNNSEYTMHDAIGALNDVVTMIRQLAATSRIKPYFKTLEELGDMHDVLVDAINADKYKILARQEAEQKEGFKKRSSLWTKWEYDEDDKYVVIAPKAPVDIAEEGIILHHCVRSFIPKVANGSTNIMFIREREKTDTPFFTVEVLNSGTVRQIHGACNRNVASEPGLENFVKKWMKAKKLKATNYNGCLG